MHTQHLQGCVCGRQAAQVHALALAWLSRAVPGNQLCLVHKELCPRPGHRLWEKALMRRGLGCSPCSRQVQDAMAASLLAPVMLPAGCSSLPVWHQAAWYSVLTACRPEAVLQPAAFPLPPSMASRWDRAWHGPPCCLPHTCALLVLQVDTTSDSDEEAEASDKEGDGSVEVTVAPELLPGQVGIICAEWGSSVQSASASPPDDLDRAAAIGFQSGCCCASQSAVGSFSGALPRQ